MGPSGAGNGPVRKCLWRMRAPEKEWLAPENGLEPGTGRKTADSQPHKRTDIHCCRAHCSVFLLCVIINLIEPLAHTIRKSAFDLFKYHLLALCFLCVFKIRYEYAACIAKDIRYYKYALFVKNFIGIGRCRCVGSLCNNFRFYFFNIFSCYLRS